MKFEDFLRLLAEDKELADLIDKALLSRDTGEKLLSVLEYHYYKYLFLRKVNYSQLKNEIKQLLEGNENG